MCVIRASKCFSLLWNVLCLNVRDKKNLYYIIRLEKNLPLWKRYLSTRQLQISSEYPGHVICLSLALGMLVYVYCALIGRCGRNSVIVSHLLCNAASKHWFPLHQPVIGDWISSIFHWFYIQPCFLLCWESEEFAAERQLPDVSHDAAASEWAWRSSWWCWFLRNASRSLYFWYPWDGLYSRLSVTWVTRLILADWRWFTVSDPHVVPSVHPSPSSTPPPQG